jgi:plastocyanin
MNRTVILGKVALLLSGVVLFTTSCGETNQHIVHMNDLQFLQTSITIQKGETITLVDDSSAVHMIENGKWDGGTQRPYLEPRAPKIEATIAGNSRQTIGPFTTAGIFHLYCSVHPDMELTVIVH